MQKGIMALCLASAAIAASPVQAGRTTDRYTSLTVFGDSLVDAGNVFALTGGRTPAETSGYFQGRFTNGYDYTDLLSLSLFNAPTVASLNGGANYAYGGARILQTNPAVLDLQEQFSVFTGRLGATGRADANGLYVLNFGGNDQFNAGTLAPGFGGTDAYFTEAARVYARAVADLDGLGARSILITGFPVDDANATRANQLLTAALNDLTLNADTTVLRYDYVGAFARIAANPTAFGVEPITTTATCQSGGRAAIDNGCAGYSSFDGIHPIATIQRAIFRDMDAQFGLTAAIPEPAAWSLMILGFAMVGAAARRPAVRTRYRFA